MKQWLSLFLLCIIVGNIGNITFAASSDSLRAVITKNIPSPELVDALNQYGMSIHETYPDSTRLLATKALHIADSLKDLKGKALSLNSIGVSFFIQNNYEKSLEYYLQALSLREKIADMKGVAGTLNNVGMVYRDMKEHSTALTYYYRALRLNDSLENKVFLVRNLNNIGVAYENMNEFDSALAYHRQSIAMKRLLGDKSGVGSSLRNIGKVYVRMKRYNEALATLREALTIPEISKQVRALLLLDIAQVREETGETQAAINDANASMMLGKELGAALILQNAHEMLARLYTTTQDHKTALDNYQRFIEIRDSLFSEKSTRRLAALQTNYEIDRQRAQIELLTKETQLQNTVRNGLIGGFALMLGLLMVSGIAYRNKRRSNQQLHAINAEILRQQHLLEQQAVEIEIANNAMSEKNIELERSNSNLSALNNEKNEIMGIVAHDLKNPIGAVRGLADMIATGFVEGNQVQEVSTQIVSTSDRMLDLVKNLLDVNRLDSGGMQFQMVEFHLRPVVEATVFQYEEAARQKNISLHFSPDAVNDRIQADEQAMMQIVDNIISNAVKYSPHGKNVWVRLRHSSLANGHLSGENNPRPMTNDQVTNAQATNDYLRIEVADEGPGISPEDMKKMFGKFARLSARPTGGEHSTGLGLSIVKKMVEAMNGRVWCESEIGKGATFIVELPKVS
jgi:signal transduction histidine kinase